MLFTKPRTPEQFYKDLVERFHLDRSIRKRKDVTISDVTYTLRDIETMHKPDAVELLLAYQKEYTSNCDMIFTEKEIKSWRANILRGYFLRLINQELYQYYLDLMIARAIIPEEYSFLRSKIDTLQKTVKNQPYL